MLVVVGDDRDAEVSVLSKQWSSLQLGAHLDLFSSLSLCAGHSPQSDLRARVLILKWSVSFILWSSVTAPTLRLALSLLWKLRTEKSDVTFSLYLYHPVLSNSNILNNQQR